MTDRIGRRPVRLTFRMLNAITAYRVTAWPVPDPAFGRFLAAVMGMSFLRGAIGMVRSTVVPAARAGTAAPVAADYEALPEPTAQFKAPSDADHAAGFQVAQETCMTCHAADSSALPPSRKDPAFRDTEVATRIKVSRAPIEAPRGRAIAARPGATD